jgi:serine protease Do
VAETPVGRAVPLAVVRDGTRVTLTVTVGRLAENEQAAETPGDQAKPSLGLALEPLTPELASQLRMDGTRGVVVRAVQNDSPAANAGLRAGDVIVEVDHQSVGTVDDVRSALVKHSQKEPLLFLVHRNGATLYVAVTA